MKKALQLALAGSTLAVMFSAIPAKAAEYGFCRHYAHVAIEQFARAESNPYCASQVGGLRWHADYNAHFEWCLGVAPWTAERERDIRSHVLYRCTRGI